MLSTDVKARFALPPGIRKIAAIYPTSVGIVADAKADALWARLQKIAQLLYASPESAMAMDAELLLGIEKQFKDSLKGFELAINYDSPDTVMLDRLRNHLHLFSGAKTYTELKRIGAELIDENGKARSFADFKSKVLQIHTDYNVNYLNAEYEAAVSSSQMAAQWLRYEQDAALLPNLEFVTAGDNRVRVDHQALDGIIRPINDAFWDTHYPPLGFRCRCNTNQRGVAAAITPQNKVDAASAQEKVSPIFAHNVGKTAIIFNDSHPYLRNSMGLMELDAERDYGRRNPDRQPGGKPGRGESQNSETAITRLQMNYGYKDVIQLKDKEGLGVGINPVKLREAQYAHKTTDVLAKPDEVWQQAGGKVYYVKYYNEGPLVMQVQGREIAAWMELPTGTDLSQIRKGILQ